MIETLPLIIGFHTSHEEICLRQFTLITGADYTEKLRVLLGAETFARTRNMRVQKIGSLSSHLVPRQTMILLAIEHVEVGSPPAHGLVTIHGFENGIHHSAQQQAWADIVEEASASRTQILATTDSMDTILAFAKANKENPDSACLIRLSQKKGQSLQATTFTIDELNIAIRDGIEVR